MDFDQTAKADNGKLQISLVPTQIIRDIAEVRMYGNKKYGDPDNWKNVEKQRYVDALLRHLLSYIDDPTGVDPESGIPHYKHAACNMAFICAMESNFSTKMNSPDPVSNETFEVDDTGLISIKTWNKICDKWIRGFEYL